MASKFEWVLGILVFLAIFSATFFLVLPQAGSQKNYKFEAIEQGIVFHSNESSPADFLKNFKDQNEFIIVISLHGSVQDTSFSGNASVMLQAIITASGKKSISLVKQFENESLAYCQTNMGLAEVNKQITAIECEKMLASKAGFIILESPDASLKQAEVLLEKNKVFIKPKKASEMQTISYFVLKAMFADSEQIVKQINDYLQQNKVA